VGVSGLLGGALASAVAGAVLFGLGAMDREMAEAQQDFTTQQYARADASLESVERYLTFGRWLPWLGSSLEDVRTRRAAIRYWTREYDALLADQAESPDADALMDLQLIAANAVYRRGQGQTSASSKSPEEKQRVLDALQTATSAYLAVLRSGSPESSSATAVAAYNYEFVVRTRDDIDKGRQAPELTDTAEDGPAGKKGGSLPDPPKNDMKMLVPLEPGEMDQGLEPGQGGRIERKG
jgi:hypothetical protein